MNTFIKTTLMTILIFSLSIFSAQNTLAHCDTYDGPVIQAAERALEKNDVNLVLVWTLEEYEIEIKHAFEETIKARAANPKADHYFFEELVRVHRLGEGESYTGIKPKGTPIAKIVQTTDKAIETKSLDEVFTLVNKAMEKRAEEMLHKVLAAKNYNQNDIEAGREYVEAYVEYTHYLEILHNVAEQGIGFLHTLHGEGGASTNGDEHNAHSAHGDHHEGTTISEHDSHATKENGHHALNHESYFLIIGSVILGICVFICVFRIISKKKS
ncbi:LysM domain-containing protein [Candidatus Pacearchaeota archaeon]|nr:LysM domain-containing protein [Candidatus Pacearchaeota archaeon]